MRTDADVLISGTLFRGVDPDLVTTVLQLARPRSFAVLETLMAQGDVATSMHVILRGSVRVVHHTEDGRAIPLADLGPGEGVGEMGLIDARPRIATVVATEPTDTLELDAAAFASLARSSPEFYEVLTRVLTERLRRTTQALHDHGPAPQAPADAERAAAPPSGGTPEENRALVARCRELVVRQDAAALQRLVSPGLTWFGLSGVDALREGWRRITERMGDAHTTIREVVAEGDRVVELTSVRPARHAEGEPDEAASTLTVAYLYRIEDGKIAEIIRLVEDPQRMG